MTTTVTVEAHCAPDVRVDVVVDNGVNDAELITLRDGEKVVRYVHDNREIRVREVRGT